MNDLRRAYAVLGLPDGSAPELVKKRYRTLVRTWHPDRFAADPRGQEEATVQLQLINAAYRRVMKQWASPNRQTQADREPSQARTPPINRRLTREEIESMVNAIGTQGPVDVFLGYFGRAGDVYEALYVALFAVALFSRVVMVVASDGWIALLHHVEIYIALGIVVFLCLREYFHRRRPQQVSREHGTSG